MTLAQGPRRTGFDVAGLPRPVRGRLEVLGVTVNNDGRLLLATYAPLNGPAVNEIVRFHDGVLGQNWYDDLQRRPGVPIERNIQATELVSDAASLAADPDDFYRILGHTRMGGAISDPNANYYSTARLAERLLSETNSRRPEGNKIDTSGVALVPPYRQQALRLSNEELAFVQREYMALGTQLAGHFDARLRHDYPPHFLRPFAPR